MSNCPSLPETGISSEIMQALQVYIVSKIWTFIWESVKWRECARELEERQPLYFIQQNITGAQWKRTLHVQTGKSPNSLHIPAVSSSVSSTFVQTIWESRRIWENKKKVKLQITLPTCTSSFKYVLYAYSFGTFFLRRQEKLKYFKDSQYLHRPLVRMQPKSLYPYSLNQVVHSRGTKWCTTQLSWNIVQH